MIRIVESKYITSAVKANAYPPTVYPDFAFVGRSNVGKSSMINTITNRKLLAKIANRPGKTRLINFFECRVMRDLCPVSSNQIDDRSTNPTTDTQNPTQNTQIGLVDLPGYGFAKVSKAEREQWQKMINEFFIMRKQLAGVVVLVDIRHDPDPKDAIMVDMLKSLNVNFMIAATKCDKIPKGKIPAAIKKLRIGFGLAEQYICEFSSHNKTGQDKILNWIETYMKNEVLNRKVIVH